MYLLILNEIYNLNFIKKYFAVNKIVIYLYFIIKRFIIIIILGKVEEIEGIYIEQTDL